MDKININGLTQEANCEQLDAIAHDYLGVQTSLDDESYGCRKDATMPFVMPTVNATDGVYNDTKAKLAEMGVTVNGTEWVRLLWKDSALQANMESAYPQLKSKITTTAIKSITSMSLSSSVKSLNDLNSYFPGITAFNDTITYYILNICLKYIKTTGYYAFSDGKGAYPSSSGAYLQRLVLPSLVSSDSLMLYRQNPSIIDFGPNCKTIGSGGHFYARYKPLVLRNKTSVVNGEFTCDYSNMPLFVPQELLSDYKSTSLKWSNAKIYPIGGPTWAATFGSTDPYADLTEYEKECYDELFPDLYKDWVAPPSDE